MSCSVLPTTPLVLTQGLAWLLFPPGGRGGAEVLCATGDGERNDTRWPMSPLVRHSCACEGVLLPEADTDGISGREGWPGWLGEEGVSGMLSVSSWRGDEEGPGRSGHSLCGEEEETVLS